MTEPVSPQSQPPPKPSISLIQTKRAAVQALRVMIACTITYAVSQLLHLQQGYWAVFTVLIVMQASVGATAGMAVDRLVATVAGAMLGGAAVFVTPPEPLTVGIALICVVGFSSFVAARVPRLRNAGLTAAIVMLTHSANVPVEIFVIDRIAEITLGGVVGVLASLFILPTRSRTIVLDRFGSALDVMARILRTLATAVEKGEPVSASEANIALRQSLMATETLLTDAQRERALWLTKHGISEAIPRSLWRIRNDMTYVSHIVETPFPPAIVEAIGPQAGRVLEAQARFAEACGQALRAGGEIDPKLLSAGDEAFEAAFSALQNSTEAQSMGFSETGRLFGLDFTLRRMRQNFLDLADRIRESDVK
ncbi:MULTISPECIES: FUSC family protein [unclassified Rhizobium]|uniref:FUSC family protein n=1 Tax=unclassified Rhizobium TaxID=2613769 RepID=UPI000DDCB556|nr:FUSC family protein [Rhizobium sp. CNPSo 4062]MDK4703447.1 FUSC family protein [Rhizobium sp. CNPSo 4062]